jgi:hypothetical protein
MIISLAHWVLWLNFKGHTILIKVILHKNHRNISHHIPDNWAL